MTTASDIISQALRDINAVGMGQTADAEDASNALDLLNQMLAQWQVDGYAVYTLKDVSFAATGAASYTIGAGGNVNRARIDDIDGAFWRSSGVDYPLTVIDSFDDYQLITQKALTGQPCAVHYQPTYPLGALYVYPAPTSGDVHLTIREEFTEYASLADDLALPKKYVLAVRLSLAELLATSYPDATGRPDIARAAAKARRVLKRSNVRIATLKMPAAVLQGGHFNIVTGE
jgi:hypothetical protein